MSRSLVIAGLLLATWSSSIAHAQLEPAELRIVSTAGVGGRFGRPLCEDGVTIAPVDEMAYLDTLAAEAHEVDAPLLIDAGGLVVPHGVARFATEYDTEALAELVQALGYRAIAFGHRELATSRKTLVPLLRAIQARGVPVLASNLRCEGAAGMLCDVVHDATDELMLFERPGRAPIALAAFIDPTALEHVAPDRREGLSVAAIADALPAAVDRARALGATAFVAIVDLDVHHALELTHELPEDRRPEMLVLGRTGDEVLFARPPTVHPAIVVAPRNGAVEAIIRPSVGPLPRQVVARPMTVRERLDTHPVEDFLERIGPRYCHAWGHALSGGTLTTPLDHDGFAELVANLMRLVAGADVAILNRAAVSRSFEGVEDRALTESDVHLALPFDEPLVYADVDRDWLEHLMDRAGPSDLVTPGLAFDDDSDDSDDEEEGDIRVRGRSPVTRATYRIVTLRFLALGGDGSLPDLPPQAYHPLTLGDDEDDVETLRQMVRRLLASRSSVDPRDRVRSIDGRAEWILRGAVDGTFSGSSVTNPANFDAALLSRSSTLTLGIDVELHADADAPDFTWENGGTLSYRTQWTQSTAPGVSGAFTEAVDQLQLRSLFGYRGLRGRNSAFYVPDPYVEVFTETELTRPDSRNWHWLLFRPTVGARFPLADVLSVKLQAGLQSQLLSPTPTPQFGVGGVLTLTEWYLLRDGSRGVRLAGTADYFIADLGNTNAWQLRTTFDAAIDLIGPLALTLGVQVYAQEERDRAFGAAVDATAGIRLASLGRVIGP